MQTKIEELSEEINKIAKELDISGSNKSPEEIKKHFSKSTFIDDSLSKDKSLISQSINGINL